MQLTSSVNQGATKYVALSKFKVAPQPWELTLILAQAYSQNTFYEKHVLREGESAAGVAAQRKKLGSNGNYFGVAGANTNHSTFILLDRIEIRRMILGLGRCVLENHLAGALPAIGTYIDNLGTEAIFDETDCVVTVHNGGATDKCRSIRIGGIPRGLNAAARQLVFEISHSDGHGAT